MSPSHVDCYGAERGIDMVMLLVQLAVVLVVLGLIWWLLTSYLPLPPPIKMAVTVLFALAASLVLLQAVGLTDLGEWPSGRLRVR